MLNMDLRYHSTSYMYCEFMLSIHNVYFFLKGSNTIKDFLKFADNKKTRIFHFIHASRVGLEAAGCVTGMCHNYYHNKVKMIMLTKYVDTIDDLPGELSNIDDVNVNECIEAINSNRERIVGIKIRLSADLANDGSNEPEACR